MISAARRTKSLAEAAPTLEAKLREANDLLATSATVSDPIREMVLDAVDAIRDAIPAATDTDPSPIDPYLLLALQRGIIDVLAALEGEPPGRARLRVGLEEARQALRDLVEGLPVQEDRPVEGIVRWLVEVLDVSQAQLAALLGTSPRTLQRWASTTDQSRPTGEEARRVRVVARIVANLRHALTGPGVVRWFERPSPELRRKAPAALLDRPDSVQVLTRLAGAARSSGGA